MPDHPQIYRTQAAQYDALVACEDYLQHILPALQDLTAWEGRRVVELGAGTGRLTTQLAPLVGELLACDISRPMLRLAAAKLNAGAWRNWGTVAADHRSLPVADNAADVVLSGWSVCYLVVDHPADWPAQLDRALAEVDRVLRPGGKLILLETLGTGFETPTPPEHLWEYYRYLDEHGFERRWIRTDYCFEDRGQAETLTQFFFGEPMLEKIQVQEWGVTLPECTGLWWR